MRIDDVLYFSPNYKYIDIDLESKDILIDAFKDRTYGFYLNPAKILNTNKNNAFAIGVLCVATIDFLARISFNDNKVGQRIIKWLMSNIPENFNDVLAKRFYNEFRNGLIHEGLIKQGGQFSFEIKPLIIEDGDLIIVNPKMLLKKIMISFEKYEVQLRHDDLEFQKFKCAIIRDFYNDFKYVKNDFNR